MLSAGAAVHFLLLLPAASGVRELVGNSQSIDALGAQDPNLLEGSTKQEPPPGGGGGANGSNFVVGANGGELAGLRHELAEAREELAELKQSRAREKSKLDEAFEQHAGKRLLFWSKDQVFAFLAENGQTEVGQRMREEHVDGTKLFEILQDYSLGKAARFGLENRSALEATKLDLWNYLAAQEAPPQDKGLSAEQKSAKEDMCSLYCSTFEVEYVFGYEWALFPAPSPWPNPIHAFSCSLHEWKEFDIVKTQVFGRNSTDTMFNKVSKDLGNWLADLLGTISANLFEALVTMGKCALCSLCIIWQNLVDKLEKVSRKIAEAKAYLLVTTTTEKKNAAWDAFSKGFQSSLADVFKMHEDGGAAAQAWRRRAQEERERGRLYTDEEIEERMAQVERQQQIALEAVTAAREASYERAGKQLRDVWKPKLQRAASYAHGQQGVVAIAGVAEGSRTEADRGALNASSLAETRWDAPGLMLPEECKAVLDPKMNPRAFRDAWHVALNIEEPKLGDAYMKVAMLDFAGAANALIPEVLVMLEPVKKEMGICLEAPEKLREAQACSCTNRHKGMCVMSMKYRVLSNMIRQEWPPMSPTWRQRWTISKALDRSVLHTCLGEDQVLGGFRSKAKRYSASESQNLTVEEEKANLDYQDCRYINKRVQDWDTAEDGSPKYGPLIWFAAMQVWAQEANKSTSSVWLNTGHSEPDVDPFLHQFCDAVLDCEAERSREDKVFEWRRFVESFGNKSATKGGKKESPLTRMKNLVARNRTLMHKHWAAHANSLKKSFYPQDVLDALQSMHEAYIDRVKPLMTEMLDLRTDFLSPPSPFKPQLARMTSDDIYPPFERLENPEAVETHEWAQLHVGSAVNVYVWLEVKEDAGYAELHSVRTCEEECKKCTVEGADGEITPEWLMTRDQHVRRCKGTSTFLGGTTPPRVNAENCKACLQKAPRVSQIVDCNRLSDLEFYSLNHPVQMSTNNKWAIVHTYWPKLAQYSKAKLLGFESPFKRTFIQFTGKSDYQRRVLHSELFATIRDAGKCFCLCEKLRDYTAGASCHTVVKPNVRYLDGLQDTEWCLPDDSELPSAVCVSQNVTTTNVLATRLDLLPVARAQLRCFHGLSFRSSKGECMRQGLRLASGTSAARLLTRLKMPKIWKSLHMQIEELEANNFANLSKKDVALTTAFKSCLDLASAAQPNGSKKIVGLGAGRVWATEDGPKQADMERAMLNGEFAYRMRECVKQ